MERPEAIIVTISQTYIKERGYKNWIQDFLNAMINDGWTYWLRLAQKPKFENLLYVYLLLNGRIRFRCNLVGFYPGSTETFQDGRIITAKNWCVITGPLVRGNIPRKGFQGFRYSETLF